MLDYRELINKKTLSDKDKIKLIKLSEIYDRKADELIEYAKKEMYTSYVNVIGEAYLDEADTLRIKAKYCRFRAAEKPKSIPEYIAKALANVSNNFERQGKKLHVIVK